MENISVIQAGEDLDKLKKEILEESTLETICGLANRELQGFS